MRKSNRCVILGLLATIGAACWYDAQVGKEGGWHSAPPSGTPAAAPPTPIEVKAVAPPNALALEPRSTPER